MWDVLTGFDPAILTSFIAAGFLLIITPGAVFLFISASGISGGPRIGMAAALGVNIGVTFHVLLAAAGVSAVLLTYPASYQVIKYLGAAYLSYLAIQARRSTGDIGDGIAAPSVVTAIKRGF
ncbi:MAG: LysE family translocator, partial [Amylibacter sp.]